MSGNPDYTKKNIYSGGANGPNPDTVYYGALNKAPGQAVTTADWRLVEAGVNQERVRRGSAANSLITSRFQGLIEAADLNYLKTAVEVIGKTPNPSSYRDGNDNIVLFDIAQIYTGGFQGVSADRVIYAEEINAMVDKVNGAGAVCVCNCNYCTCNCNYCTCNCNYSCTCNCNY